jgi:hypothetical protein
MEQPIREGGLKSRRKKMLQPTSTKRIGLSGADIYLCGAIRTHPQCGVGFEKW